MNHKLSYTQLEMRANELLAENLLLKKQLNLAADKDSDSPLPETAADLTLQTVIDNIPQAIFWKDHDLRYLGANMVFIQIAGLKTVADITGLSDYDLPWKKKEADFFRLCDKRVMDSDQAEYNIVERQQNASGQQTWLNTNKIPLHDNSGQVIGILGTFEDITERIRTEEMLKDYETITATIDDLVAIIDRDHVFKAANNAHTKAYGLEKEAILGKSIAKLVGEEDYQAVVKEKINQALKGETITYERWSTLPGWGKAYLHVNYFPLFSEQGDEVIGVVAKVRDMTQNKKLEAQLQQAQKMEAIGRLAGGIAHDFNNILSVINGCSELCLMKLEDNHPCEDLVNMIKDSGIRAARLTEQLLAFSRRQIIKPERMNLADELSSINQMLVRLLGENIDIELFKENTVWDVKFDRSQLEQIVMNLAINAKDAMAGGGKLTIEITNTICHNENADDLIFGKDVLPSGEFVLLAFSDNGVGMSQETLQNVFEPFFTTKEINKGTGLGLSTVYGIIKQNMGHISVYSELGKGTTFKLYFPRCVEGEKEADTSSDKAGDTVETGRETILLVEDDNALRRMCVEILKDLGYTVLEASNGEEAIETSSRFHGHIDLLLTDVVMPTINGPETARALSIQHPDIAVLFMSGYTENAIVHHSVLNEGINFLNKPISRKALAKAIRKALLVTTKQEKI